jgi:hypothetical protein
MKTSIKLSMAVLMISLCSAFTSMTYDGLSATYSVSENDPSQIELRLNKDYTFTYQDFSIASKKIMVSGTYQITNNMIQLISGEEKVEYHDKWKLSNDNKIAKSRKGLTFYTLHKK